MTFLLTHFNHKYTQRHLMNIISKQHKGKETTESFKVHFNLTFSVNIKSVSYRGKLQTSKPGQRGVKSGAVI